MLKGVFIAKKKDGTTYYRSSMTFRGKHISLGSYESEQAAHEAYLCGVDIAFNNQYEIEDILGGHELCLPFDKAVSLINFRDNGFYFHCPIYIRENYFEYFIDTNTHLKFDADDLFYYSKHKIMARKGHLFVSEYGMQVSILSRFGIWPYSICGRDYIFKNGDTTDYRYSNIQVINKYFGVERILKKGQYVYQTKIHINGSVNVGIYKDEISAAIAYNKAADILNSSGFNRNFTRNYIEEINDIEYSKIYSSIRISDFIRSYNSIS